MNNLFNEQMTSLQARTVLFSNVDGKTEKERAELFDAYKAVLPAIIKRETYEGANLIL